MFDTCFAIAAETVQYVIQSAPPAAQEAAQTAQEVLTKESLVQDLCAVMLVAGLVAAVFQWLGWPKVIGFIAAGTLISLPGIKPLFISQEESVKVLANLGIILLMFNLGLELNIRKLKQVGGTALPAAGVDLFGMVLVGFLFSRYVLGWEWLPSLFMGVVICDSSTTLLAKSLAEMKCEHEKFASVIFSTTLLEDIMTIGVMAVLTGLAKTGQVQTTEVLMQLWTLFLFLVGVLVFGILLLPQLLNRMISRLKDDETVLLVIMGICFGISLVAERLEFSLALGAFLVGAVVSESSVRKRVMDKSFGLRTVFSAVFFVSVGMMVNPAQMWQYKWGILLFVAVVVVFKTLHIFVVSYLSGQSFREALQIGIGLAQIGDFAYLVALLGMTLFNGKEPYPGMYQIAVGVSIITTLLNPFLLKNAGRTADFILAHLPPKAQERIGNYTANCRSTSRNLKIGGQWKLFIKNILLMIMDILLMAVVFVIGWAARDKREIWESLPNVLSHPEWTMWAICSLLAIPFLVYGFVLARRLGDIIGRGYFAKLSDDEIMRRHQLSRRRFVSGVVTTFGVCILLLVYLSMSSGLLHNVWAFVVLFVIIAIVGRFKWDDLKQMGNDAQVTLWNVLNRNDAEEESVTMTVSTSKVHITVPPGAGVIGVSLKRLRLRNHTGGTVTAIIRKDGTQIPTPGPDDVLAAGDTVIFTCLPGSEQKIRDYMARPNLEEHSETILTLLDFQHETMTIPEGSPVCDQKLADLRLRNRTGATIVRIVRNGKVASGVPGPNDIMRAGDLVTFMGTVDQLDATHRLISGMEVIP